MERKFTNLRTEPSRKNSARERLVPPVFRISIDAAAARPSVRSPSTGDKTLVLSRAPYLYSFLNIGLILNVFGSIFKFR